jgi:PAS domain S-box-containing protein/putative nucleotidyltransferase with HDIG domain
MMDHNKTLMRVLVLEDRPSDAELVLYELKRAGFQFEYERVDNEPDYLKALAPPPDIILADYSMPQFTAMQALHLLKERSLDVPFIVVTGTISEEAAVDTMKQGAADYLLKDRLSRLSQAVERALEQKRLRDQKRITDDALRISEDKFSKAFHLSPDAISITRFSDGTYIEVNNGFGEITGFSAEDIFGRTSAEVSIWASLDEYARFIESMRSLGEVQNMEGVLKRKNGDIWIGLISARTIEVNNELCLMTVARDITERKRAEMDLQRAHLDLAEAYDATIEGWSRILDLRDRETEGHTQRVTEVTVKLARALGVSGEDLLHLKRGALLHDIGKMGIPDEILHKPGPLTAEEWTQMRKHPEYAYNMLHQIVYLRPALDIPYCHHERWDGTGYPRGLVGEQIPLAARIFAIVDVWDALCSDRPYRKGCTEGDVLAYIADHAEIYFDPKLVEAFLRFFKDGLFKDTGTQKLIITH